MKAYILFLLLTGCICSCNRNDNKGLNNKKGEEDNKSINMEDQREFDPEIIGTWKNTEVLGAGTDMSFISESFIKFNEDGSVNMWNGAAAGAGISYESDESNGSMGKWYTKGNELHFIDPATGQDAKTYYTTDGNRLLLDDGGSEKKIYQRTE